VTLDRYVEALLRVAHLGVDVAHVLQELRPELVASQGHGSHWLHATQGTRRLSCGYFFLGVPAGDQVAEHSVQTAGHLGPQGAQVPAALGPQFQYGHMVLGCHVAPVFGPERSNGHRAGVVGVVLIGVAGRQEPYSGTQFRLHVNDNFARGHELLGQQVAEAADNTASWPEGRRSTGDLRGEGP
jgi:hypothetical protein